MSPTNYFQNLLNALSDRYDNPSKSKIDARTHFFGEYITLCQEYDLSLIPSNYVDLKALSKQLCEYKKKDIIKELFENLSATLEKLEEVINVPKAQLFLDFHTVILEYNKVLSTNDVLEKKLDRWLTDTTILSLQNIKTFEESKQNLLKNYYFSNIHSEKKN